MKIMVATFCLFLLSIIQATAADDAHFISDDIYFVAEQAIGSEPWVYAIPARMVTAASKKSKGEAEFLKTTDGNKLWTRHFWKTRIGSPDDVKVGSLIIGYDRDNGEGVLAPPENRQDAIGNSWFLTKVTDKSDLYKGYLLTSRDNKIGKDNIRIIIK